MQQIIGVQSEVGQLFRDLVEMLVDDPGHVAVNELPGSSSTIIEVVVWGGEMGRILGRRGRLANALRELARCVGWRDHRQYKLDVIEGEPDCAATRSTRFPSRDF